MKTQDEICVHCNETRGSHFNAHLGYTCRMSPRILVEGFTVSEMFHAKVEGVSMPTMLIPNDVRRYKPIEYDEMPGEMVTAEDFIRMYESITNHMPDPPPTQPKVEEQDGEQLLMERTKTVAAYIGITEDQVRRFVGAMNMAGLEIVETSELAALREAKAKSVDSLSPSESDGIGWCSSCDKTHEVARPKCPSCGDWLIFGADDKPVGSPSEGAGWTSVQQELPPPSKNVAILVEDANVSIHGWATAGYYHSAISGWWHGTPGDYRSCNDQRWTVTHWTNLPAPPVAPPIEEK
jgi:hypothetical protein